ncbi:hypothetical protein K420107F6_07100 [Lactonifactor longoviformis]
MDVEAATRRKIAVCNVPDHCIYEVASHAFAFIMCLKRQLWPFVKRAREGGYAQGTQIRCTRIRGEVMGMKVLVYDLFVTESGRAEIQMTDNLGCLQERADVSENTVKLTWEAQRYGIIYLCASFFK